MLFLVVPVKTGIQYFKTVTFPLDFRFRGSDVFFYEIIIFTKKRFTASPIYTLKGWSCLANFCCTYSISS